MESGVGDSGSIRGSLPFTILLRSVTRPLAPARIGLDMVGAREGTLSVLNQILTRPKDVILGRVKITRRGRCDAGAPEKNSNRYSGGDTRVQHNTPRAVQYRSSGKKVPTVTAAPVSKRSSQRIRWKRVTETS